MSFLFPILSSQSHKFPPPHPPHCFLCFSNTQKILFPKHLSRKPDDKKEERSDINFTSPPLFFFSSQNKFIITVSLDLQIATAPTKASAPQWPKELLRNQIFTESRPEKNLWGHRKSFCNKALRSLLSNMLPYILEVMSLCLCNFTD